MLVGGVWSPRVFLLTLNTNPRDERSEVFAERRTGLQAVACVRVVYM
jgi:hypothetical protein